MAIQGTEIVNARTGQRMRFVRTAKDTNGALLELDCFSPPNGAREPEHIHPQQENSFEVHGGTLVVSINGKEQTAVFGDRIVIPPGVPHRFWAVGDEEAHYFQAFRPALQTEAFFELFFRLARENKLNEQGLPNLLMLAVMGQHFWNEIQVTSPPPWLQRILYAVLAPVGRAAGYHVNA